MSPLKNRDEYDLLEEGGDGKRTAFSWQNLLNVAGVLLSIVGNGVFVAALVGDIWGTEATRLPWWTWVLAPALQVVGLLVSIREESPRFVRIVALTWYTALYVSLGILWVILA